MNAVQAKDKFYEARARAVREDWLAHLHGRPDDLLAYEAVTQVLQAHEHGTRAERRSIPLDRIVGSVGRYQDFTRSFMPRAGVNPERWSRIEQAIESLEGLPPVDVYQIGDVYFVADGNHRVSVARANGFNEIDAYVTTIPVDLTVNLQPGDSLDQVIIKAEQARFMAEAGLDREDGAGQDITFTHPGGYTRLLEHVAAHRYFMMIDCPDGPEPEFREAAADWYANVYRPIVAAIGARNLLSRFPGMTAADLYAWVSARILELHRLTGQAVSPDEAAAQVAGEAHAGTPFYRTMLSLVDRLADRALDKAAAWMAPGAGDALLLPGLVPEAPLGPLPETIMDLLCNQ